MIYLSDLPSIITKAPQAIGELYFSLINFLASINSSLLLLVKVQFLKNYELSDIANFEIKVPRGVYSVKIRNGNRSKVSPPPFVSSQNEA
jgi:hypothetical protein